MKTNIAFILVLLGIVVMLFLIKDHSTVRVYDCGMAEWHPDIPNSVREECRRLRYEEWKRQQQEEKGKLISV
jgi:hypothetical protein